MKESDVRTTTRHFSPHATLAAMGLKINAVKLLDPIKYRVVVLQKSILHTPFQKLTDAFIAILAGAHGLREVNTRVPERRERCNAPSVATRALSNRWFRKHSMPVLS